MRTFLDELKQNIGEVVQCAGWVHVYRDQGKMVFFDLRDMSGIVQCVVLSNSESLELAKSIRSEWVVKVEARVNKRPEKMTKEGVENGDIELEILNLSVLSEAETPPFDVTSNTREIDENIRLEYRYMDMRSYRMQKNLRLRSQIVKEVRGFLYDERFTEIETPLLSAPTKEGSRDFVVPSRHQPGKFYALPQSPQQYKQLLMAGGFERYFQIAKAMRDEDLRADRSYEHTQIDLEMSFVTMDDVMDMVEGMTKYVVEKLGYKIKENPFPRFEYNEALEKFGGDKFDLRSQTDKENKVLAFAWVQKFPFFEKTVDSDDMTARGDWTFTHNPFSMPLPEHIDNLLNGKNIGDIVTQQYDLVCNGFEVGGGSIRSHRPEILKGVYKIMGYSDKEIDDSIGHMLKAFKFGVPPHGGIALGLDRLVMILSGEENLREVQAFPMTRNGNTAVMNAPIELTTEQLQELGLITVKKKEN